MTDLLEQRKGSGLSLGDLLLDLSTGDSGRISLSLDGHFSKLSNESFDLLRLGLVDLGSELLDRLVGLGGNRVGRVGSLDQFSSLSKVIPVSV